MPTTSNPDLLAALDPGVLAELAHMQRNGRPGFMQRVIELYLRTAAELIGELETASVKNEPAMLFRASHTLKPCSATVGDRKSTRLNSSHLVISYAVFCLKNTTLC